ncbi:MAG: nucleotidyltransferase family protein [Candidatus Lokiarchaeia archaeon]
MLTKERIVQKIEENKEKIKKYKVKKIGVFGSYVSGQPKEKSDIDILVEFEEGKITFDNYMGLKLFLEDMFNCKVDLVIAEDIKQRLKPYIMREVAYAEGL